MAFTTLFVSCKKDDSLIRTGKYEGTFTNETASGIQSTKVTIKLKKEKFSCTGETWETHAGGSGTYTVDDDFIIFSDVAFRTFDPHRGVLLAGHYKYTYDGNNLMIVGESDSLRYIYDLKRK